MNEEIAKILLQFLQRVDLKGAEVPAFNAAWQEIAKNLNENEIKEMSENEEKNVN